MSNSPLVSYTKISPNQSGKRVYSITRITPHCVVGQCAIESLGNLFSNPSLQASSNYGIAYDGRVGMFVEEDCRSWCSSSWDNDQRGVTIECASDAYAPWAFRDNVYEKLIELCIDICQRNGKTRITWIADKNTALNYKQADDEMLLTVHRWFANKACPGDWLMARMDDLAARINAVINPPQPEPAPTPAPKTPNPPNKGSKAKEDYNITYNSYVPGWEELGWGWLGWMGDGETSGTQGQGMLMEAIQMDSKPGITLEYQLHSKKVGNSEWFKNGQICGPINFGLQAEAFRVKCNKKIKYRAYCQKIGWTEWVTNGQWAGTRGKGLRMEAIQVKLA